MRDEMVDLAVFIIVLGVVLGVMVAICVPMLNESNSLDSTLQQDKTVYRLVGENLQNSAEYDGKMSNYELILCTQVQDYGMPIPKSIYIPPRNTADANSVPADSSSRFVEITSTYKIDMLNYGLSVWDKIKKDSDGTRYNIVYNFYEDKTSDEDDNYTILRNNQTLPLKIEANEPN